MNGITISSTEIAFGAAGLIITISLVALTIVWKTLREMVASLPDGQRRVIRSIRAIRDEREKDKATFIMSHFIGCMSLGASIALAVIAMAGIISVMLGYKMGFYQQENYEFGRICLFVSVGFFTLGFYLIGFTYIYKVMSLVTGKPELLTTDLTTLPSLPASVIAERRKLDKLIALFFFLFFILLFALLVFNPFGTWENVLAALGAIVLIFFIMVVIRRIRSRRSKSKTIS